MIRPEQHPASNSESRKRGSGQEPTEHLTAEIVRLMLAEAWEAGFDAGERDVFEHQETGDWDKPCIPNPYREAS